MIEHFLTEHCSHLRHDDDPSTRCLTLKSSLTHCVRLWWWDCHWAEKQRWSPSGDPTQLSGGLCVEVDFLRQVLHIKPQSFCLLLQCSTLFSASKLVTPIHAKISPSFSVSEWNMFMVIHSKVCQRVYQTQKASRVNVREFKVLLLLHVSPC